MTRLACPYGVAGCRCGLLSRAGLVAWMALNFAELYGGRGSWRN